MRKSVRERLPNCKRKRNGRHRENRLHITYFCS
ncbi:hypothetical protein ANCDUO_17474 [Ancylostoma duodenale]|uniref:Uncharacterized protein n=1 Tax=Ancylostoma duodenale TaxID=51022 RepID=A0A0C2FV50_9BILA|nr:hypothetical protein ANCDUO_17474 [Ancylostoma duodenale]